jgi:hypothetical protein
MTGMWEGNEADEVARLTMVTWKEDSARSASRMGAPTEPDAPRMRTFSMWFDMVESASYELFFLLDEFKSSSMICYPTLFIRSYIAPSI